MSLRHRILIAIERNELAFWTRAVRVLARLRERSLRAGARADRTLEEACVWADDACCARREELAFLHALAQRETPAQRDATTPAPASAIRLAA